MTGSTERARMRTGACNGQHYDHVKRVWGARARLALTVCAISLYYYTNPDAEHEETASKYYRNADGNECRNIQLTVAIAKK